MTRINYLFLAFILAMGLFLRVYGLGWGLPTKGYYFSYNSDEVQYIKGLSAMSPLKLDFDPNFYAWGSWHFYELGAGIGLAKLLGIVRLTKDKFFYYEHPQEMAKIYLAGRAVSVFFSLAVLFLTFFLGKRLFGIKAGLLASLFLAVSPGVVVHTHYLKADISVFFWITLLLLAALFIFETARFKWYALAGVLLAISASAQYNGLCFWPVIFFAHFLRGIKENKKYGVILTDKRLYLAYLIALLIYFMVNPQIFPAIRGILTRQDAVANAVGMSNVVIDTFRAYALVYTPVFVILAVLAFLRTLVRRNKNELLVLLWFLPYLIFISVFGLLTTRYQILISSGVFILTAGMVVSFYERTKYKFFKPIIITFVSCTCLYAALYSFAYAKELARTETVQQEASGWIKRNIPAGEAIGICGAPEIRHYPEIIHQDYYYKDSRLYNIINLNNSIDILTVSRPQYLVMDKKAEYYDSRPKIESRFMREIDKDYKVIRIFERCPSFYGLSFRSKFLIGDWETPFPIIAVLKRK